MRLLSSKVEPAPTGGRDDDDADDADDADDDDRDGLRSTLVLACILDVQNTTYR
jgi:hypothetical protein